jgi:hypothetical protein
MLIVALVMAVIGLAALVTAVVTSNEVIAWVCIGASVIGVVLLIVDALRERQRRDAGSTAEPVDDAAAGAPTGHPATDDGSENFDAEYPDDLPDRPGRDTAEPGVSAPGVKPARQPDTGTEGADDPGEPGGHR